MALTKVTYTDDVTVIGAQNLNAIQDEIISLETTTTVAVGTDLNTVTTLGKYRLWGAYTNAPSNNALYGYMDVIGSGTNPVQIFYSVLSTVVAYRGYTNSQWYSWRQLMQNSGGTFSGTVYINLEDGTTSVQGYSSLILGNNKTTGTAGNSAGDLQIYGRTDYKTEFISPPDSPTANRVIYIPDASGTIALEIADSSTTASITSGWTATQNVVFRRNKFVEVNIQLNGGTITSGQWNTIATIPSGYRSKYSFDTEFVNNSTGFGIQGKITTAGAVQVYGMSTVSNNLRLHVVYALA